MKEFVEELIKYVVDEPDEVQVTEILGQRTIVFEARVAGGDMGQVIGRKGENIRSIRTLLIAVAARYSKRAFLEILDTNGHNRPEETAFLEPDTDSPRNNNRPEQDHKEPSK